MVLVLCDHARNMFCWIDFHYHSCRKVEIHDILHHLGLVLGIAWGSIWKMTFARLFDKPRDEE